MSAFYNHDKRRFEVCCTNCRGDGGSWAEDQDGWFVCPTCDGEGWLPMDAASELTAQSVSATSSSASPTRNDIRSEVTLR